MSTIIPRFEIGSFDFHGSTVTVVTDAEGSWAVLGQLCQNLTLDAEGQRKAVLRKSWSKGRTVVTEVQVPGDSQARPQFLIHERIVPMWLANITTSRIKDAAKRDRVELAQVELADALYAFVAGRAVSAPLDELQVAERYVAALKANRVLEARSTELEIANAELRPKADSYERYLKVPSKGRLLREVAKPLGWQERTLRALLADEGVIFTRWSDCGRQYWDAKAEHIKAGRFTARDTVVTHAQGTECLHYTLYVLQPGVDLILRLIERQRREIEAAASDRGWTAEFIDGLNGGGHQVPQPRDGFPF